MDENKNKRKRPDWHIDWHIVILYVLVAVIATIGAGLMYLSIFALTGSIVLAVFAPAFSEAGAIAWKIANERPGSSEKQEDYSRWMTWVHVIASGLFLFMNMIREMVEYVGYKIDGIMWGIVAAIAVVGMLDLIFFLLWREHDDDLDSARTHAREMRKVNDEVRDAKRRSLLAAEQAKARAIAEYWQQNAAAQAKRKGEIEAEREIASKYGDGHPNPRRGQ